jgi:hypothetical protein
MLLLPRAFGLEKINKLFIEKADFMDQGFIFFMAEELKMAINPSTGYSNRKIGIFNRPSQFCDAFYQMTPFGKNRSQ